MYYTGSIYSNSLFPSVLAGRKSYSSAYNGASILRLGDRPLRQWASQLPPLSYSTSSGVRDRFASRFTNQGGVRRFGYDHSSSRSVGSWFDNLVRRDFENTFASIASSTVSSRFGNNLAAREFNALLVSGFGDLTRSTFDAARTSGWRDAPPSRFKSTGPVIRLGDRRLSGYSSMFDGTWLSPKPKDWLAPSYTSKGPVWRIGYSNLSNSIRERTLDLAVPNIVAGNVNPAIGNEETRIRPLADKSNVRDGRAFEARGYDNRRDSNVYSL